MFLNILQDQEMGTLKVWLTDKTIELQEWSTLKLILKTEIREGLVVKIEGFIRPSVEIIA